MSNMIAMPTIAIIKRRKLAIRFSEFSVTIEIFEEIEFIGNASKQNVNFATLTYLKWRHNALAYIFSYDEFSQQ